MALHYTSGPLVNDLLFLAGTHRADYVFQAHDQIRDGGILRIRRADEKLWVYLRRNPITENVLQYIRLAGFSGIIDCEYRRLDSALISALVERWRPETHTFHMPFGEVTITLQDVAVLLGLKVDGNVIGGATILLQLWAWERIPSMAPRSFQQIDWNKSYGARYACDKFTGMIYELNATMNGIKPIKRH
ncbi:hypothetical protein E3N88_46238 [Mikania micrantha]|uniref:Aminotransferase-like plant mobile domain-containing protein n=1 Tax=Mikania micrantha TaxID=192012 RepID=A0A5N6L6Z5_9ASTR|nr:hypothetical protein E3N88_46238 [Mikania micrantha]